MAQQLPQAQYQVELINRDAENERHTVQVAVDQTILEAAEQAGLRLPVGCRYGACITCAARLIQGEVEQSQAVVLKPEQQTQGYVLLCVASPLRDCQIEYGLESQRELYRNPFLNPIGKDARSTCTFTATVDNLISKLPRRRFKLLTNITILLMVQMMHWHLPI